MLNAALLNCPLLKWKWALLNWAIVRLDWLRNKKEPGKEKGREWMSTFSSAWHRMALVPIGICSSRSSGTSGTSIRISGKKLWKWALPFFTGYLTDNWAKYGEERFGRSVGLGSRQVSHLQWKWEANATNAPLGLAPLNPCGLQRTSATS